MKLVRVFDRSFSSANGRLLSAASHVVRKDSYKVIQHKELKVSSITLLAYADGSFGNTRDKRFLLGYLIIITDASDICILLCYRYFKTERIARSVLGTDVMDLAEPFDCAYIFKHDTEGMVLRRVSLTLFTDTRSLFVVLTKNVTTI